MARDFQLPQGQLNPAARPVNAFVSPVDYQVAQPGRPAELPGVDQLSVINTGGTPNIQGYNRFSQLYETLVPFTREAVKTAQAAGLAFAGWQMQKGEAEFMAAYRKAQVNVDQQGEVGESQYAKASREIYAKDQSAGMAMWLANPYRQMGADRAKSRLAGQEIQYRMAGIEGQIGGADYEKPDQGFAKLQSLRAGLIADVTKAWGVDENTPGFQKYAAPAIEKAAERSANNLIQDRQKYFDEMRPKQLAELLRNEIYVTSQSGEFEYQGNRYNAKTTPQEMYWLSFGYKLNDMARDYLGKAGPGGMASKWAREAYTILQSDARFRDDQRLLRMIGTIKSSEPLRGVDGKPVNGPDGQPVYLTWDQLYRQENIDSQIKYEQAGFQMRAARSKDIGDRGGAEIAAATEGMLPGPERFNTGLAALDQFVQQEEQRIGRKLTFSERFQIRKTWKEANDLNDQIIFQQDDPGAPTRFFADLGQQYGTAFNATRSRQMAEQIAAGMANQNEGRQFLVQAYAEIQRKEKDVQDFSGYTSARDKVINDNITARLRRNYEFLSGAADPKADREESERRQRLAYTSHVNARIREKEAQLKRKLTESEVIAVAQEAIDGYGNTKPEERAYLYPGSAAYPGTPSVDPYRTIKPTPLGPDGKPKGPDPVKSPDGKPLKVYDINQLDAIPNRGVVLRQYRSIPVLSLNAIRDIVFAGIEGKSLPAKFERAWRTAGARSAFEFLQEQLDFYPNYSPEWSTEDLQKLRKRLQSYAGSENGAIAYERLRQSSPALASLQSWALL